MAVVSLTTIGQIIAENNAQSRSFLICRILLKTTRHYYYLYYDGG